MMDSIVQTTSKTLWHPRDIEYFTDYPAPVMQAVQELHYTNINTTITFFGPMLYFLVRSLGCEQVLEIGHAEGYTSFYLASAVKDNATRFKMEGNHYYGIDIAQTEKTKAKLESHGLPITILNMDSIKLRPETFGVTFDLIFQDGAHDKTHVAEEFKNMWPALKGGGHGYWIAHDAYGPAEDGCREIRRMIDAGEYNAEYVRIDCVYGLMVIRKMDGYDQNKRHWTQV